MLRNLYAVLVLLCLTPATSSAQPATDIYLGILDTGTTPIRVGSFRNITARAGYDNQPFFMPDGASLLYTSIRDGQADTYRFDLASGEISRITYTSESEYSPTPMPKGGSFSVIQVEADSTQRLWHFDFEGTNLGVLLADVKPVGYQAWVDTSTVALFVLGEPATLQVAHITTGTAQTMASSIGRSLHRIPGGPTISFVHMVSEEEWWIKELDPASGAITALVQTLPGSQDYAWTQHGMILMGSGSKLFAWSSGVGSEWREVADLAEFGITDIGRIAVSLQNDRLALVSSRPDPGE